MPLRTQRRIKSMIAECITARRTIEDTVDSAHRVTGPSQRSWGQFLDAAPGVPQTGIYGTAAAIEILSNSNHSSSLVDATDRLPGTSAAATTPNPFDISDLDLTFKCVSIIEALEPDHHDLTTIEDVERRLRSVVVNRPGWGYHNCPGSPDTTSRVLPTSLVLGALSRSTDFRSTPQYRNSIEWLAAEVTGNSTSSPLEKAFSLIALSRNSQWALGFNGVSDAIKSLAIDLSKWAHSRNRDLIGSYQQIHYWVPSPSPGRNHYMFYPTDLIVSWALLSADAYPSAASFVTNVVQCVVNSVKSSGAFPSPSTGKQAITDALWSHKVLTWFIKRATDSPASFVSRFINTIEGSLLRRALSAAILFSVSLGSSYLAAINANSNYFLFAAFGLIAALTGGILATILWDWAKSSQMSP